MLKFADHHFAGIYWDKFYSQGGVNKWAPEHKGVSQKSLQLQRLIFLFA